jgi:sugar phosphate isomerase/epimerase
MTERIVSVNTMAFQGYPFPVAFKEIAALGISYVELAFTVGYAEGFSEETFSRKEAMKLRRLLSDHGLKTVALAAHMDLGLKNSLDAFQSRMDFAARIGAKIIHSNSSTVKSKKTFMENIEKLAASAGSLGLTIGLENPGSGEGNLIGTGRDGARIVSEINSPFVGLNYDIGNLFSYSRGKILPEEDIRSAFPFICHIHFKDLRPDENGWSYSAVGGGIVNYREVIHFLRLQPNRVPVGLELPLSFRRDGDSKPHKKSVPPTLEEIRGAVKESFDFVKEALEHDLP